MSEFASRAFLDRRDRYVHELEDGPPEELRLRLAAMAHALQMTLSLPTSRAAAPDRYALENIMRAVAHNLEVDPSKRGYVVHKLEIGLDILRGVEE